MMPVSNFAFPVIIVADVGKWYRLVHRYSRRSQAPMKAEIVKDVSAPRISLRADSVPREPLTHWDHSGPSGPTMYFGSE